MIHDLLPTWAVPFFYWIFLTLCYYISKYSIITQRMSGYKDFDGWERLAWYIYITIIVCGVSCLLTLFLSEYDKTIKGWIDHNVFIIVFVPTILGVNSAYKLSYEECKKKDINLKS